MFLMMKKQAVINHQQSSRNARLLFREIEKKNFFQALQVPS